MVGPSTSEYLDKSATLQLKLQTNYSAILDFGGFQQKMIHFLVLAAVAVVQVVE